MLKCIETQQFFFLFYKRFCVLSCNLSFPNEKNFPDSWISKVNLNLIWMNVCIFLKIPSFYRKYRNAVFFNIWNNWKFYGILNENDFMNVSESSQYGLKKKNALLSWIYLSRYFTIFGNIFRDIRPKHSANQTGEYLK